MEKIIISAGRNEVFPFALSMGVGLVDMSINLTRFLCKNEQNLPSEIVFIGSAGLYKDGEIFEIYKSSTAANIEISSLEDKSYSPIYCEISSKVSHRTLKCNSSNFITKDFILAHKLYEMGYFLENMEFFSVLKVAENFKIPAYGIFVATNFCNPNAHKDFMKNHEKARKKLEIYLKNKGLI